MPFLFIQSLLGLFLLTDIVFCTTEWFGDLRAHMNPPKSPPFYDIVYDESDCPVGLESVAIPDFVYFGEMIATKTVREHSECLQFCLETERCKAVNFFESLSKKDPGKGFCELLVESQYDNPRLMRPFRKATYYEKIHCRAGSDEEDQPFTFKGNDGLVGEIESKSEAKNEGGSDIGEEKHNKTSKLEKNTAVHQSNKKQQSTTTSATQTHTTPKQRAKPSDKDPEEKPEPSIDTMLLKKLAEKIHEFNDRFRT